MGHLRIDKLNHLQWMAIVSIVAAIATLVLKFSAYFLTQSISLYSDALESFINLATGFIALAVVTIAAQPPDEKHTYGHYKAEYFASGVEGGLILVAAGSIVYMAIERLLHKVPLTHLPIGLIISAIASGINFMSAYYIGKSAKKHDSITLEANAKHLMTDVWTSLGVVLSLVLVHILPPAWQILDSLIAILVATMIVITGFDLVKRSIDGFMDASLPIEEVRQLEHLIQNALTHDQRFMDLRTRKAGTKRFVEFKLIVSGDMTVETSHELCDRIEQLIETALPGTSVVIHVEPLP